MRSSCELSVRFSCGFLFRLIWPCLFIFFSLYIDCNQANALSYLMDKKSAELAFYMNIEEIQKDNKSLVWIENTNIGFDGQWNGWRLAPYPVHIEGALYYALIFEEQSILMSQVQVNSSIAPSVDILPIPECPTLFLMGIGLLGIGAFIRCGAMKKVRRFT